MPGTRLAAVYFQSVIRLVFQGADLRTYEINHGDNWQAGTPPRPARTRVRC